MDGPGEDRSEPRTFDNPFYDPMGFKAWMMAHDEEREREACTTEPEGLGEGRKMTCQHEGDIQRLMIDVPRMEQRVTSLEGRMTAFEEMNRVEQRANEIVQAGRSAEQIAYEKRRNAVFGLLALIVPIITVLLTKALK